jgi:RNA polymerase sigma factor (sigma-70 family)
VARARVGRDDREPPGHFGTATADAIAVSARRQRERQLVASATPARDRAMGGRQKNSPGCDLAAIACESWGRRMDAPQLTDLIRRHARLIQKIAYAYCRDATDREDIVQEVAVQLWRSHHKYDARYKETTWIYRIALNVAISFHRRERRHREHRQPIDDQAITIAAAAEAEPGEDVQLLLRCIDDLSALDKALVLLYLDGNDHASIADVLGISVSNVGTKLGRIKDRLRVAFAQRALEPTGGSHAAG